jgi:hypothetical protein
MELLRGFPSARLQNVYWNAVVFWYQECSSICRALPVDVNAIRTRFIQENLLRALQERDKARLDLTARAFRVYFQWFEDRFSELDRLNIASQLAILEESSGEVVTSRSNAR